MFDLCLFDLDETLLKTSDIEDTRVKGKNNNAFIYRLLVIKDLLSRKDRHIYSENLISSLRTNFPNTKFGVFTRSPRSYADAILSEAYPNVKWDTLIAYEDVDRTKPYGEGILKAMQQLSLTDIRKVVLVGDGENDIRAAYNAGCIAVLDQSSWGSMRNNDNWHALNLIPDAIIEEPSSLIEVLRDYRPYLPVLERRLEGVKSSFQTTRIEKIGKFLPREFGGDSKPYPIYTLGRLFSGYDSIKERRSWHQLTDSIHACKEATDFPVDWCASIQAFLEKIFPALHLGSLVITTIPPRPGRAARLNNLLVCLKVHLEQTKYIARNNIAFEPNLLAYKNGVKSNSQDKLNSDERFKNVMDHLYVNKPNIFDKKRRVLIIDDVCTTGSSLITAGRCLEEAGSGNITRLAMAMNISDVLK